MSWTTPALRRMRRRAGMKNNRLSRFAIPYVIWMALFVVAPYHHGGDLRLLRRGRRLYAGQLRQNGHLYRGVHPLLQAGPHCHRHLRAHRLPRVLYDEQGGPPVPAAGHGAHHAAHVDELPAADLFLDGHSGEQRPFEPAVPEDRADRPLQQIDASARIIELLPDDQHPGGRGAGHGV